MSRICPEWALAVECFGCSAKSWPLKTRRKRRPVQAVLAFAVICTAACPALAHPLVPHERLRPRGQQQALLRLDRKQHRLHGVVERQDERVCREAWAGRQVNTGDMSGRTRAPMAEFLSVPVKL